MKKFLIPSFAAVLLLAGCDTTGTSVDVNVDTSSASSMMMDHDMSDGMMMSSSSSLDAMEASSSSVAGMDSSPSATRIIEMTVEDWKFSQSVINVKQGENVIIRLTNKTGTHSFTSSDLGINVAIDAGETKDIPLPTNTSGTFAFRCAIPCGPGHMDMKGSIVIS